jgi:hypothetical protein
VRVERGATRRAVVAAVVVAVGAASAPLHAGVVLAIAAGIGTGMLAEGSDR